MVLRPQFRQRHRLLDVKERLIRLLGKMLQVFLGHDPFCDFFYFYYDVFLCDLFFFVMPLYI
jgi:hypothetical protein